MELTHGFFQIEPAICGMWKVSIGVIPAFYCESEEKAELVCELFSDALRALAGLKTDEYERMKMVGYDRALELFEIQLLSNALGESPNKSAAARLLGLERTTFLGKVNKYGLDKKNGRESENDNEGTPASAGANSALDPQAGERDAGSISRVEREDVARRSKENQQRHTNTTRESVD